MELVAGRGLAALFSAVWFAVVARRLSLADTGDLALLLALGALFNVVADFGLPQLASDQVGRAHHLARPAVRILVVRRLPLAVTGAVLITSVYFMTSQNGGLTAPSIFAVSVLLSITSSSVTAIQRSVGRAAPEAVNEAASRLGVLIVGTIWLFAGGGLLAAVTIYAVAEAVSAVVLVLHARRTLPQRLPGAPEPTLNVRTAAPFAFAAVVGTLYYRIDTVVVSLFHGGGEVARYATSYRLLEGALLPAYAVAALVVPRTASLAPAARASTALRYGMATAAGTALLVAPALIFAGPILALFFGEPYRGAAKLLRLLVVSAAPGALVAVCTPVMAMVARRYLVGLVSAMLLANMAINLALVPSMGGEGAALATLGCQVLLAMLILQRLRVTTRSPDR